ncbi:SpoIIE family protein phosphatase [Planomonospora sp. ID91781]|uniref:SpoIIE family protein phosphatase n=1 Tax=Planomonospora sp. ID91781 TaxID=2738135 RepID=UPI0027DB8CC4|nr:SpoIIE family protein phosphatase [Planomonospora sp. ID91781]
MTIEQAGTGSGTGDGAGPPGGALPGGALLQAVFAGLGEGLYLTDRDGRISAVNPRAAELLGRPAETMLGADAHDLLHRAADGSVIPRSACSLWPVLERGLAVRGGCARFLCGTGHLLPVSWSVSPVLRDGRIRAAAVLFTDATEHLEAAGRRADQLAALERLADRLAAATEAGAMLARTPEADEALRRLGRLIVPRLAEWAAVDLRTGSEEVRRVAVVPPEGYSGDPAWEGPLPPVTESSGAPLARVLRGGEALLLGPDDIAACDDEPLADAHRELVSAFGATSVIIAPLRTARRILGALTVARTDPARPFDAAELALVEDLGRRAGLAVDGVRLSERRREVAETMQRQLLPPLPQAGRLGLAARYRPAPEGSAAGGDWYDVLTLADGATALVVGDVAGHDVQAAARMAQLSNMLRSIAWDRVEPPSLIVDRLENAVLAVGDPALATLVLARIEGPEEGPWQLHWASAGHPPPLLVTEDGRARYLESAQNVLVGVEWHDVGDRHDAIEPLPARSTVLLYTNGLVHAPGTGLDTGLDRLRRRAAALARRSVEGFCDELLEGAPPGGVDDIALLALRVPGPGDDS